MQSEVEVLPSARGRRTEGGTAAQGSLPLAGDVQQLKELLRPLVVELIDEELRAYRRLRG